MVAKELTFTFRKTIKVTTESTWGTPSFVGACLPDERQITEKTLTPFGMNYILTEIIRNKERVVL